MDENVKKNYEYWCTSPIFDDATKSELKSLEGNEDEIFDRFYRELEFGTGGLRGVIGAGTNRMNFYTVGKATQGLANYINKQGAAASTIHRNIIDTRYTGRMAHRSQLLRMHRSLAK